MKNAVRMKPGRLGNDTDRDQCQTYRGRQIGEPQTARTQAGSDQRDAQRQRGPPPRGSREHTCRQKPGTRLPCDLILSLLLKRLA